MRARSRYLFLALVAAQAAHSMEEYGARIWEVLGPARFVSSLFSRNLPLGFAIANAALILLGLWCYWARVRAPHRSSQTWAWFWTLLEAANGTGHLVLAVRRGGYFAGAATAPLLLALSVWLGATLVHDAASPPS